MTLLVTIFAAAIFTVIWYKNSADNNMCLDVPCWCYWGASLMWMVDAVFEYAELGAEYFRPGMEDMVNDSFLGLACVALGLVIWVIVLLIKDPKSIIKSKLLAK